ncbi:MAG: threonylcarbamoyl-AMP synthase [Chlorobi bacterium]|nr:threonylcarbamoyl-AMP synthase [Chlorobiota bacterium]
MLIRVHPENPGQRQIIHVVNTLEEGGIIIYPTDSVYAMGCDISNNRALEKLARIKGKNPKNPGFSFIFSDLRQISDYSKPLDKTTFKLLKRNLPGPFTFILPASNQVPKMFKNRKKTIGVRIPACNVTRAIVQKLGRPLLTTSIHDEDEIIDYITDPELIFKKYQGVVDLVVDGGPGNNHPTTIVDCTGDEPVVIREGLGVLQY